MLISDEISKVLKTKGADFVHYVDISQLSQEHNKGLPNAILISKRLSKEYLQEVSNTPDYFKTMTDSKKMAGDEFHLTEEKTDKLADYIADYLIQKGYKAYSQSEDNIEKTGYYNENSKSTPLPHKTIALIAGLGWIGNHDLLVTDEYGSAISMCTLLTDAPLNTVLHTPGSSQCGECDICKNVCPVDAIKGRQWEMGISRNELVDASKCTTCLLCMVMCPWTRKYIKRNS